MVTWRIPPPRILVTFLAHSDSNSRGARRRDMDRKSPLPDSKFKQWLELFYAAGRETDATKRRDRIEAAQTAIHERVLELSHESNDSENYDSMLERWLIDVALMNLRSLLEQREAA